MTARQQAFKMVDAQVNAIAGMSAGDLGDDCEMADLIDEAEGLIEAGQEINAKQLVKETIDFPWIEANIFG